MTKRQEDINKLNYKISGLEIDYQNQLSDKLHKIEKLNIEIEGLNKKVSLSNRLIIQKQIIIN